MAAGALTHLREVAGEHLRELVGRQLTRGISSRHNKTRAVSNLGALQAEPVDPRGVPVRSEKTSRY